MYTRMANPGTPEGKAQLERQSPLTHAAKIKTPLVIVQGANDPRVKKAEADQIVVALRDRGYPVEYILAPDEGHGFQRPVNNLATFAAAEKFFAAHLGGRFEEGMTPEVAQRLKEISVDPKSVTLAPRVLAPPAKPTGTLAPGTWRYAISMVMGANTMNMETTTEVKQDAAGWVITDTVKTPQGTAVDRSTLDKTTLAARTRSVQQGPVTIELSYEGGKAKGEMKMGANAKPIAADLTGEIFADGAGAHQSLGALPLAEGYAASVRNFDLRKQKEKVLSLAVAGVEETAVPAGKYAAWKLLLTDDDGSETTVWIDQKSRAVVRVSAKGPAFGGGTITAELTGEEKPAAAPEKKAAPAGKKVKKK
jgi:hypothetical protein